MQILRCFEAGLSFRAKRGISLWSGKQCEIPRFARNGRFFGCGRAAVIAEGIILQPIRPFEHLICNLIGQAGGSGCTIASGHATFITLSNSTGCRDSLRSLRTAPALVGSRRALPRTGAGTAVRNTSAQQPGSATGFCRHGGSMPCLRAYSPKHCPDPGRVFAGTA
jgi:hypothetical protein